MYKVQEVSQGINQNELHSFLPSFLLPSAVAELLAEKLSFILLLQQTTRSYIINSVLLVMRDIGTFLEHLRLLFSVSVPAPLLWLQF